MTERKPPGVRWETWIDRQIREAQDRGEFDNLSGKGKPIEGLEKPHDEMWWVKDFMKREQLTVTPPTLALRKAVESALEAVQHQTSEDAVRAIVDEVNAKIRDANRKATSGPPSNVMPLDVERVVASWRSRHAAH